MAKKKKKKRASVSGMGAEIFFGSTDPEGTQPLAGILETSPKSSDLTGLFPGDVDHTSPATEEQPAPEAAADSQPESSAAEPQPATSAPAEPAETPVGEETPTAPGTPSTVEEKPISNGEMYRSWRRSELGMPAEPAAPSGELHPVAPSGELHPTEPSPATDTETTPTPAAAESPLEKKSETEPATPKLPEDLSPEEAKDLAEAMYTIRSFLPDIGTPDETIPDVEMTPLTEEDLQRARRRVTQAMIHELNKEIDALYKHVRNEVSSNRHIANNCLRLLHEARQTMLTSPGQFADAELKVEEVRIILRQAENSEKGSHSSAKWIFLYDVIWFLGLLILLITDQALANWLKTGPLHMPPLFPTDLKNGDGTLIGFSMVYYFLPWLCMLWGGVGGVVGSLYSLRWYVSRRQYDIEHNLSYLAHPIMGVILGGVVYFLFRTGFFALQAIQANAGTPGAVDQILTAQSPVLILISVLAGFKQKFVYEMLDRVMRTILRVQVEGEPDMTGRTTTPQAVVPPPPPSPPPSQ